MTSSVTPPLIPHRHRAAASTAPGFGGFEDIFSAFTGGGFGGFGSGFGGSSSARRNAPVAGSDLRYNLTITFEEAAFGTKKEILVPREENCAACGGTGAKKGTSPGHLLRLRRQRSGALAAEHHVRLLLYGSSL